MSGVSVIIPTFNRERLVGASIQAVLSQTVAPSEVLVVDDCSDDATRDRVGEFGDAVTLIEKSENQGKAHSINLAMAQVRHPYVWVVDDDDLVTPDALEKLLGLLGDQPHAGFAYGRHMRFREDEHGNKTELGTGYWTECAPEGFLIATMEDFFVHQPGMIVRRDVMEQAGPVDQDLPRSQDYDLLIRIARIAPCASTEDVVFYQRQHDGLRGIGKDRFGEAERDAKWMTNDQKIFEALYHDLDLSAYLNTGREIETDLDRREALLQRGTIMARKKIWSRAMSDFETAAGLEGAALSPREIEILKRAFASKYGCGEIVSNPQICRELKRISGNGSLGAAIVSAIARGLDWRVKKALQSRDLAAAWALSRRRIGLV